MKSHHLNRSYPSVVILFVLLVAFSGSSHAQLTVKHDKANGKIEVFRADKPTAVLTQNARSDFRPYLHPIVSPIGDVSYTQYSPGHHKHQTGLYWGITRVNGRDYFHHPEGTYWKRIASTVLKPETSDSDPWVSWQTVYDQLDENGQTVLQETQNWTMRDEGDRYVLDLVWKGKAEKDVTVGKYDYGGLFLRMPWTQKTVGQVVNSARNKDARAEGQRAVWLDVGMHVPGQDPWAHIAIFDHPKNGGFPTPWRVDGQMGVGPVRARLGDWKIKKGETATFRHQIQVYAGKLNDVDLTERWSKFSGQGMAWAQWKLAQREGKSAEFLNPQQAVQKMTMMDGFKTNVFASEPMMTQPMAFCWDDRGRLWIAENRDYENRGKGFANHGDSRILILEDTDRDGVADTRKVFSEGIPFPSGMAVGFGGLWLGAPPNLLFVPDKDGDDVADTDDIEIRLTGWGIRDRHETLNSFHWGPDGWLYGCQGFATPSIVGKPKGEGRLYKHKDAFPKLEDIEFEGDPVDINGGVWRYHPTKKRFEVVAHGFSNPWGIDYDRKGQLFITACVIPHLWHVIPGGIYHRQGGRHFNPHVYTDIRTIADHRHRSAHGGARVYQSDAFPPEHHNRIFMANIHEHAVLSDILEPKGSGFVGRDGDDFLLANNAQWIGFSAEIGPEGGLYILDWHDGDICGNDVRNKDTGRVFRIMPDKSLAKDFPNRYADLAKLSDIELARLQTAPSAWHAQRSRMILQYRATQRAIDAAAVKHVKQMFDDSDANEDMRLRAMWVLHGIGAMQEPDYLAAMQDRHPYVRGWAMQMLCEDHSPSDEAMERLATMANGKAATPIDRLYLSIAMQRLGGSKTATDYRWRIAEGLARYQEDADDHNLPRMHWFAVEPLVVDAPERAIKLAKASKIPLLSRHIARRLTAEGKLAELVAAIGDAGPAQRELLFGMREGMDGRSGLKAPAAWQSVYAKLREQGGEPARTALHLSVKFGDEVATRALLETVKNRDADLGDRTQALRGLAERKRPELKTELVGLLDDQAIRKDAIRAMAAYDDEELAKSLLSRYDDMSTDEKLETVITLSSRSKFGRALTDSIKSGAIPRRDIPAYVARALQRVVGNGFLEVWGPIEAAGGDKKALFDKYRKLLTEENLAGADLSRGRLLFNRTCQACHRLYGEGGRIGPEITGANRSNLDYLLGNILTPSADIQDSYRMELVLTDNGRMYSGIPSGEDRWQLSLRIANQDEPVRIPKSQIEDRETAKTSMMPEGLLTTLKDEEVVDLIGYLRHLEQVPLPSLSER